MYVYTYILYNYMYNICIHLYTFIYNYTSSTAQGGDGSLKNRKPIGKGGVF